ncbi:hypothetical protein A675_01009, partial [Salmonella enterica subsp. enterica serovar Enteritidis str. 2009K1726]
RYKGIPLYLLMVRYTLFIASIDCLVDGLYKNVFISCSDIINCSPDLRC